ncbi:acyloxyacyl hydrolase [Luteimonas sp. MC1750]|uniref:acyloxyacyl hydrolase n=1 Tax=Luteimonas sp. MC1750 TaxID=2799326 RepID=UPI0018F0A48F|nr:acyloxyacyl hydrolase [Luteimonas sp. MC1750]MBJ6983405.1 acyloxyacyl hydrolase [Luteimonas sp. MC1750]QQO06257.1 acyloxyacyl hydrolase [Luteimonas sp. MC1750]
MQLPCGSALRSGVVALALAAAPLAAAGSDIELAAGASTTTDREFTRTASIAWVPKLRDLDNAVLRAQTGLIYVDGRGPVTDRDLEDEVWVGYVGLRYERTDNGLTLGAAIGAQSGETDALSGDPQFVTSVGWRWDRFSLSVRHISNASLHSPNNGETALVGAWRF